MCVRERERVCKEWKKKCERERNRERDLGSVRQKMRAGKQ